MHAVFAQKLSQFPPQFEQFLEQYFRGSIFCVNAEFAVEYKKSAQNAELSRNYFFFQLETLD